MLCTHRVVARRNDSAEAPCFTRHCATTDTELHAAASDDVGDCEVFSKSKRVPLRKDIEHLTKTKIFSHTRQVLTKQNQVWQYFVALILKVMFGQPHCVDADFFGGLGPRHQVFVALNHTVVAIPPLGRCDFASVIHRNGAEEICVYSHVLRLPQLACQQEFSNITFFKTSSRSVIMPSTPKSSNRFISTGSSMVQTCT